MQHEDENGIENDVDGGARKHGSHGKRGAAVRADDGIHHIHQHEHGEKEKDDEKIIFRKRDTLIGRARKAQGGTPENP